MVFKVLDNSLSNLAFSSTVLAPAQAVRNSVTLAKVSLS